MIFLLITWVYLKNKTGTFPNWIKYQRGKAKTAMPLEFSITTLGAYPTNKTNKPNPLNFAATTTWH